MEKQLGAAKTELASIKKAIDRRKGNIIKGSPALGKVGLAAYHSCMSTKPFRADETCIGCGKHASICPAGAINMVDGRPAWTKNKCLKCCDCINRCAVSAIQYRKRTDNHGRYVNPGLKYHRRQLDLKRVFFYSKEGNAANASLLGELTIKEQCQK